MDQSSTPSCSTCGSWWRLPLLLGLVLAAILLINGRPVREETSEPLPPAAADRPDGDADQEPVRLAIVFGDGRRQIVDRLDWYEGMTVLDAMQAAPRVSFRQQGAGASAFLTAIDGLANEGSSGRNWIYSVNGERGDRSYAVYELRPGDRVLWTFAPKQ